MRRRLSVLAILALSLLIPTAAKADLMGYWSFDDGTGTVLADTSGRGNNGTLSGTSALPAWVAGHTGQTGDYALAFTGSAGNNSSADPYVLIEPSPNSDLAIGGNQTISMWLYPTAFGVRQNPYAKAYGGSGTITVETGGTMNYYRGRTGGNSGSSTLSDYRSLGGPGMTLNAWNHVTLVRDFDAGEVRWYVNGRTTSQSTFYDPPGGADPIVTGNNPAYLGRGYVQSFFGMIDNASIWNEALDRREVIALQNDAYTPTDLAGNVYLVDVAGYTYSTPPNAHTPSSGNPYYRDENKDGGSPTGDLTDEGRFVYVNQSPSPDDGTVGWTGGTDVDITFDLGGTHRLDQMLIGYSVWLSSSNGAPVDVQVALSTDGVFDTETFTTFTGFDGRDFRNDLFLDLGNELASYVMLRFENGSVDGAKYILDEVAFFATPEPSTGVLLATALVGMAIVVLRRRRGGE